MQQYVFDILEEAGIENLCVQDIVQVTIVKIPGVSLKHYLQISLVSESKKSCLYTQRTRFGNFRYKIFVNEEQDSLIMKRAIQDKKNGW